MHASVVMPLLESSEVTTDAKQRVAELVVGKRKLIAGNFSEAATTSLMGERPLSARARRANGGYSITARKMFASMIEAADYCAVLAYTETATSTSAGIIVLVPRVAEGRSVNANWDTLGMRATRSDALILEECWIPESAVLFQSDDIRPFRHAHANWFWGSYTAVYLGVAAAAYNEVLRDARAAATRLCAITGLSSGCASPRSKDECRSRSRPAHHLPFGLAQRYSRTDAGNNSGALPREVCGR